MQVTRRQLFATIAAVIVGKPAVAGLPLAIRKLIRCECTGCQYARGTLSRVPTYEFYPDAFALTHRPVGTAKIGDTITVKKPRRLANRLLTLQEVDSDYRQILKDNTLVT